MRFALDFSTLFFCNALAAVCATVAMLLVWQVHRREPAVRYWALGFLCWATGTFMGAFGAGLTSFKVVGNSLGIVGPALLYVGTARFLGRPLVRVLLWPVCGFGIAAIGYFSLLDDRAAWRVLTHCLAVCMIALLILWDLWAARGRIGRGVALLIAACWSAMFVVDAVRAVRILLGLPSVAAPLDATSIAWFVTNQANLLLLSISYLLLASQRLQQRLDDLANRDELTGALNRRAFNRRAGEGELPAGDAALLVFDLDHFKQINDRYGHAGGDAALRTATATIRGLLRRDDLFARAGGEEFWLLLPNTSLSEARSMAERLRAAVAAADIECEGTPLFRVTTSIGIAAVAAERIASTLADRLAAADRALYAAKSSGRNRVAVDEENEPGARLHG